MLVLAKDQKQALPIIKDLVASKGVNSIMLCPGHMHKDIAEIQEAVGEDVGVTVARGDAPSSQAVAKIMEQ